MGRNVLSYGQMRIVEGEMRTCHVKDDVVLSPHEEVASLISTVTERDSQFSVTAHNITRLATELGWEPYRKNRPAEEGNPVTRAEFDTMIRTVQEIAEAVVSLRGGRLLGEEETDGPVSGVHERLDGAGSQPGKSEDLGGPV